MVSKFSTVFIFLLFNYSCDAICTAEECWETQLPFYGLVKRVSDVPEDRKTQCHEQLAEILAGLKKLDRWALKLLDASGVPDSGLHWGAQYWLGSRQQCMASMEIRQLPISAQVGVVNIETESTISPFRVAYFAAYFTHNSSFMIPMHYVNEKRITLGLCLPDSCSEEEVKNLLEGYFREGDLTFRRIYETDLQIEGVKKTTDDLSWINELRFQAAIYIVSTVFGLCIIATFYDVFLIKSSDGRKLSLASKWLQNFSVKKTWKIIFNTNVEKNGIRCINGIRVLAVIIIVINHLTYYIMDHLQNRITLMYIITDPLITFFSNSMIIVETFFVMSGFLMSYIFLNTDYAKDRSTSLVSKFKELPKRIIKRYTRLVPAYLATILLTDMATTWRQKSSPFWTLERNDLVCHKYWWRNLLFINNWYPKKEMCLSWSWYLSCDFQYYILGSVILIISTKHMKLAVGILSTLIFASAAAAGIIVYNINYIPFLDVVFATLDIFYFNSLVRAGSYLVGLSAGIILNQIGLKPQIGRFTKACCWIFLFYAIGFNFFFYQDKLKMTIIDSVIYMTLSKITWSMANCWLIIACATGNGGVINRFLSHPFWMPLSNLSFGVTLLNPIIMYAITSQSEKGIQIEIMPHTTLGLGFVVLSFASALILSSMFEWPFYLIVETLFEKKKRDVHLTPNNKAETYTNRVSEALTNAKKKHS